jgi:hypothetical protein
MKPFKHTRALLLEFRHNEVTEQRKRGVFCIFFVIVPGVFQPIKAIKYWLGVFLDFFFFFPARNKRKKKT